jgi:hypothetical protein
VPEPAVRAREQAGRKIQRQPLAWGITRWGPLSGTLDVNLVWNGPAAGLFLHAGGLAKPITHSSANGIYQTWKQAERAVYAFLAAIGDDDNA